MVLKTCPILVEPGIIDVNRMSVPKWLLKFCAKCKLAVSGLFDNEDICDRDNMHDFLGSSVVKN